MYRIATSQPDYPLLIKTTAKNGDYEKSISKSDGLFEASGVQPGLVCEMEIRQTDVQSSKYTCKKIRNLVIVYCLFDPYPSVFVNLIRLFSFSKIKLW